MFLGAGAVHDATVFCQQAFNAKGVKGGPAIFATIAQAVLRAMFTAPNLNDPSRFDRPYPMSIEADGKEAASGDQLFFLATTLEKLVLSTRPFWGGKTGPIRSTLIPFPVPSIPRWILPVMYGGENRKAPPGSASFCANRLAVRTPASFVIDGEFFPAPKDEALQVETGPDFTYVCG
jgi:hypothetical protein